MDTRLLELERENDDLRKEVLFLKGQVAAYENSVNEIKAVAKDMQAHTPLLDYLSDTITCMYTYMPQALQNSLPPPDFNRGITM